MSVSKRFDTFLNSITLTDAQKTAGLKASQSVTKALNQHYWSTTSATSNSNYIGSWEKHTQVRPARDVNIRFTLASNVYEQFKKRSGNKQSQILQEIKTILLSSFSSAAVRGDGPAVVVPFAAHNIEVIPVFLLKNGKYCICMADYGGRYKSADYEAEASAIAISDLSTKGNTRALIKMMKRWQAFCGVPIKSFWIELLSTKFLSDWPYKERSSMYHGYMIRDFLLYAISRADTFVYAPGTNEPMFMGSAWEAKARTALERAKKACDFETIEPLKAGEEWQKIFSTDIPRKV